MLCKHVPCNTLTHSTNEDLLNIKRKGDPEVLYPLSYVRYHWNPESVCNKSHFVSLFYLYWYFFIYSDILKRIFVSTRKLTFESSKGVTAQLNETRFCPKKKSSPNISRPKKSWHFLMHWMSVKLPDNFQMCEHSWPCRFHINYYLLFSTHFAKAQAD